MTIQATSRGAGIFWGVIIGIIMVVVLLFILPLVSELSSGAQWSSIDAAIEYIEGRGYYAYAADALTAGRVPYVGAGGELTDEAAFTYNTTTNVLTADQFVASNQKPASSTPTAGATDVNGTTWKDLYDGSVITHNTAICGMTLTVGGTWAGLAKFRITDSSGNNITPFDTELIQNTDWVSGAAISFNFPLIISPADGFKIQFRSTDAGDGAGETLALTELQLITY